jgi:hypothetical protein
MLCNSYIPNKYNMYHYCYLHPSAQFTMNPEFPANLAFAIIAAIVGNTGCVDGGGDGGARASSGYYGTCSSRAVGGGRGGINGSKSDKYCIFQQYRTHRDSCLYPKT